MTPWTVACQAPLSMGFPRQEYWSGLLVPSPGDLLDPGIKLVPPALQVDSLPLSHLGSQLGGGGIDRYIAIIEFGRNCAWEKIPSPVLGSGKANPGGRKWKFFSEAATINSTS